MTNVYYWAVFLCLINIILATVENQTDESSAIEFYNEIFQPQATYWCRQAELAEWNYETNITDENSNLNTNVSLESAKFQKESWKNFSSFDWKNFKNETLKRLFEFNSKLGNAALETEKLKQLEEDLAKMTAIYSTTTVCDYRKKDKCDVNLDPDITEILASSRDYKEELYYWQEWHEKTGRPMRKIFEDYVKLSNEAATLNGYQDAGNKWRSAYESDTFEDDIECLWQQIKPYYDELHAYVRHKLSKVYGKDKVSLDGPIPAHVFGNMWAQEWNNILDLVLPYPNKTTIDVTAAMKVQNYTVRKMFELSDSFYKSLGLMGLPDTFWNLSMLTRPEDREVLCHASAWDFCENYDVRIKMCTKITMEDLFVIHHEMGHVQYYMQYAKQPINFRDGANPGFHEAIGDTMVLSVSTPKHLKEVGLLPDFIDDEETDLNFLLAKSLEKIAFLPFGYLIDKWRWKVFSGEITPENYNAKWWEMRNFYQGIEPAVKRTETDFDPGAKMHVATNTPYVSYFVSFIIQFQFHEALCLKSGQYDPNDPEKPLHKCDNYRSKEAGKIFSNMLRQGSSRKWPEILQELTGTTKMNASSLINFFNPLFDFLKKENEKNKLVIGWNGAKEDASKKDNKTPKSETEKKKKDDDLKSTEKPKTEKLQDKKIEDSKPKEKLPKKESKSNGNLLTVSGCNIFLLIISVLMLWNKNSVL